MDENNFRLPPDQWALLRRLLGEALDLPAAARDAWLDALPAEHAPLTKRLRALLAHADRADASAPLLQTLPKIETLDFAPPCADDERSGELVGPYRLLRQIGEGGMATVWLAERIDWPGQRRVALKLPHGAWRRAGLVERFARERAILAALEHPHIARLYDAGFTPTAQPYLALEYVDGERIDRWCETHAPGVADRLALFLQVCDAVAHAHTRLIVHRDIKPSNVLVDAGGQVRLLDFGIAKLLEADTSIETALTREAGRALTPEYAAPEQIQGEPISTATDTYAMGVLLYELLTGRHPYAQAQASAAARASAALTADPVRPSDAAADPARRRALRGDLDTIVLKALKKSPAERYASADAFAADIRRLLAHEPVLARPDSRAYRLRKLVRRHRVAMAAGAAVTAALLIGAGLALWQAREARLQRDAALQAQAESKRSARIATAESDLAAFLLMEMSSSSDVLAAQLERARQMFDTQYRDDPGLRGRLLLDIGELFNGRNDVARANALWAEAEPLLREGGEWTAFAELQCFRARDHAREGHLDRARATIADAGQALARANAPADAPTRRDCLWSESVVEKATGNIGRAVSLLEAAIAMEERAGRVKQGSLVELLNAEARTYVDAARYRDAVRAAQRAAALVKQLGLDHTTHLMSAHRMEAIALRHGGRPLDALVLQAEDAARSPRLSERLQYVLTLLQLGRLDGLAARMDDLVATARPLGPNWNREVRVVQVQALTDLGRLGEAGVALGEAETLFAPLLADRRYAAHRLLLARAHWALASNDAARAQAALDEAGAILRATGQGDDPAWHSMQQLQARVFLETGRGDDARESADRALEWSERMAIVPEGSIEVATDRYLRARARRMLGDTEGARGDAAAAELHARAAGGEHHPLVKLAHAESMH